MSKQYYFKNELVVMVKSAGSMHYEVIYFMGERRGQRRYHASLPSADYKARHYATDVMGIDTDDLYVRERGC